MDSCYAPDMTSFLSVVTLAANVVAPENSPRAIRSVAIAMLIWSAFFASSFATAFMDPRMATRWGWGRGCGRSRRAECYDFKTMCSGQGPRHGDGFQIDELVTVHQCKVSSQALGCGSPPDAVY